MTEPAGPDAPSEDEDLLCPVCDYALRGLPEPRCPECGYTFEWAELREKARLRQGWFYEHAGTFVSHLKTRRRSLRPWSFWKEIHAYSDANPWRLFRYQATTVALLLAVAVLLLGVTPLQEWLQQNLPRTQSTLVTVRPSGGHYTVIPNYPMAFLQSSPPFPVRGRQPRATTQVYNVVTTAPAWAQWLWPFARAHRSYGYGSVPRAGVAGLMSGMALLGLAVYWRLLRGSVLRASIRPVHLSRVAVYSADVLPLLLVVYAIADIASLAWLPGSDYGHNVLAILVGPWLVVVPLTLRLASALRQYVRFPQASAVALGYGVIVGLIWIIVELRSAF